MWVFLLEMCDEIIVFYQLFELILSSIHCRVSTDEQVMEW